MSICRFCHREMERSGPGNWHIVERDKVGKRDAAMLET
jgi:hypothetical protein